MKKVQIKTKPVALEGDYEGWKATVRTNAKFSVMGDLSSGDFDRIAKGLVSVLVDWNFLDDEGKELDSPSVETIGELPFDLVKILVGVVSEAIASLSPN